MRGVFSLLVLGTVACGGVTDPGGTPQLDHKNLVGSYTLAAYNASPLPVGLGGVFKLTIDSSFTVVGGVRQLKTVDSSYTLSVTLIDAWSNAGLGRWSWTGANILLTTSQTAHIYGSILNDGVGFTAQGYPALFFRKQ